MKRNEGRSGWLNSGFTPESVPCEEGHVHQWTPTYVTESCVSTKECVHCGLTVCVDSGD